MRRDSIVVCLRTLIVLQRVRCVCVIACETWIGYFIMRTFVVRSIGKYLANANVCVSRAIPSELFRHHVQPAFFERWWRWSSWWYLLLLLLLCMKRPSLLKWTLSGKAPGWFAFLTRRQVLVSKGVHNFGALSALSGARPTQNKNDIGFVSSHRHDRPTILTSKSCNFDDGFDVESRELKAWSSSFSI